MYFKRFNNNAFTLNQIKQRNFLTSNNKNSYIYTIADILLINCMGCGNFTAKNKYRAIVENRFDSFDFRINTSDVFTFTDRARRELTGGTCTEDYMRRIFNGYRAFMIDTAVDILTSKKKPENGKYIAKYNPGPLIDEMWCLAILYSGKYKELCEVLVGAVIDRVSTEKSSIVYSKKAWPDYQESFSKLDRKFIVWMHNKDISCFLNSFYDQIKAKANPNKIKVQKINLENELKQLQLSIINKYKSVNITKYTTPVPESHSFYNSDIKNNIENIYEYIYKSIPSILKTLVREKYCIGDSDLYYIVEYARFMTMIYFSKNTLTPSEEVDHVWHLHQCLTIDYRNFCEKIYGKFIYHTPTVGGQDDSIKYKKIYAATIEFYKFLFKEMPPIELWPSVDDRFDPVNYVGAWYSLLRIFQCILRVVEVHKNNRPNVPLEIMKCYFSWNGKSLFTKEDYKIDLVHKTSLRIGCNEGSYWYPGGCAIVMGAHAGCGGGCGGMGAGCGGGCGGSGCGISGCAFDCKNNGCSGGCGDYAD